MALLGVVRYGEVSRGSAWTDIPWVVASAPSNKREPMGQWEQEDPKLIFTEKKSHFLKMYS